MSNHGKAGKSQGLCVSDLHLYSILASSLYFEMGLSVLSVRQP